jgi:hypothetical protein
MTGIFKDGEEASASRFMDMLEEMRAKGQSVLDDLTAARDETLFRMQQGLNALNSRRQRAVRVLSPDVACRFVVSDLLDIDQALTSSTVRADASTATCRERARSSEAEIRKTSFSSAVGTVEEFNQMYRVHSPDGACPTGVFEVELVQAQTLTMLVFDIVTLPSAPKIEIWASADGVRLVPATQVSVNGYRVTAWFPSQSVKYLRIAITPNLPDTLGGTTFTFGLTSLSAFTVNYYLYSELVTRPVVFAPATRTVRFKTNESGLEYFLQFGDGPVSQVEPDQLVDLPGVARVSVDASINVGWQLVQDRSVVQLPADVYPASLSILDVAENRPVSVAYGLDPALAGATLANKYVAVRPYEDGGSLHVVPVNDNLYTDESGRIYRVVYEHGPAAMTARLRVQLATRERAATPVFRGAWLENVY